MFELARPRHFDKLGAFARGEEPLGKLLDGAVGANLLDVNPDLRIGDGDQRVIPGMGDVEKDLRNAGLRGQARFLVPRLLDGQLRTRDACTLLQNSPERNAPGDVTQPVLREAVARGPGLLGGR